MTLKKDFYDFDLFQKQLAEMPIFKGLLQQYSIDKPFLGLRIIIAHVLVPNTLP